MADGHLTPAPRRGIARRGLRFAYHLVCNTLLLLIALESGARIALTLYRARQSAHRPATPMPRFGEDFHPFLQNDNGHAGDVDPGPEFAGWRIDPALPAGAPPAGDADRCRILFLGGSTTAFEYPHLLREQLEQQGIAVRGFNLGAPWHTSLHSLYKFWTYADAAQPQLVIVLENVNDLARGFTAPGFSLPVYRPDQSSYAGGLNGFLVPSRSRIDGRPVFEARPFREIDPSPLGALRDVARDSILVAELREHLGAVLAPEPEAVAMSPETYLRGLPAFDRNLRNLRASCKAKGVPVLFLTMPYSMRAPARFMRQFLTNDGQHFLADPDFAAGLDRFNQAVLALRSEPESWVLDLAPQITDPGLFHDEVHLTSDGNHAKAAMVADYIRDHALLAMCSAEKAATSPR